MQDSCLQRSAFVAGFASSLCNRTYRTHREARGPAPSAAVRRKIRPLRDGQHRAEIQHGQGQTAEPAEHGNNDNHAGHGQECGALEPCPRQDGEPWVCVR
ncbi:hypothetical protein CEE86_14280, partial [Lactobacillus crispatus]